MKKHSIILAIIGTVSLASFLISFVAVKYAINKSFGGGAVVQIQTVTTAVWAIASTTEPWTTSEQTGSIMSASVNSSSTVGTTAVQLLAPNTGRVKASVCNNSASAGFIAFNNTVTSTVGATGYFALGTGVLVPAGQCHTF